MRSEETSYRHVELADDKHRVSGFALWYPDSGGAACLFDALESSLESGRRLEMRISFVRELETNPPDTYRLSVAAGGMPTLAEVEISGIESRYILDLLRTLDTYGYVFLVTGYSDESGDHITPGCIYVSGSLWVDGDLQMGRSAKPYPNYLLDRFRATTSPVELS